MKESVIYQKILKEGVEEGQIKACQRTLVNILKERFGEIGPAFLQRIHQIKDVAKLDAATIKAIRIESLDELQLSLGD